MVISTDERFQLIRGWEQAKARQRKQQTNTKGRMTMWMIQLQYIASGNNAGGLYLNVDTISAVRASKNADGEYRTMILLTNGVEYELAGPITDVLNELVRINCLRGETRKGE